MTPVEWVAIGSIPAFFLALFGWTSRAVGARYADWRRDHMWSLSARAVFLAAVLALGIVLVASVLRSALAVDLLSPAGFAAALFVVVVQAALSVFKATRETHRDVARFHVVPAGEKPR